MNKKELQEILENPSDNLVISPCLCRVKRLCLFVKILNVGLLLCTCFAYHIFSFPKSFDGIS